MFLKEDLSSCWRMSGVLHHLGHDRCYVENEFFCESHFEEASIKQDSSETEGTEASDQDTRPDQREGAIPSTHYLTRHQRKLTDPQLMLRDTIQERVAWQQDAESTNKPSTTSGGRDISQSRVFRSGLVMFC